MGRLKNHILSLGLALISENQFTRDGIGQLGNQAQNFINLNIC